MAKKKTNTWLPPRELIDRRLKTLVRLLRKEADSRDRRKGELTYDELHEWADQIERIIR